MPSYDITACLGDVSCELAYHQLTKTNELLAIVQQVEIVSKNLLIGFVAMLAVVIAWNFLKSVF